MADTDSGGLLVQIGVTQARMERELAKIVSAASKSAQKMEDDFNRANSSIGKNAQTAFSKAISGANSAAPAVKNLSGYTANLASQLNDIGVQLAGGQSPFQIMLQQGTQIGQIAAQAGGGFKTLGSIAVNAFASILSPVNLVTFAVIGLGGAAVQYFGSILSGGEDSNKTLEEQRQLIVSTAKAWGDAIPALKEYVDQLDRAKSVGDLDSSVKILNDQKIKQAKDLLDDATISLAEFRQNVQQAGAEDENVDKLTRAFNDARAAVEEGKDPTQALATVIEQAGVISAATGVQFDGLKGIIDALGASARATATAVTQLSDSALRAKIFGDTKLSTLQPLSIYDGKVVANDQNPEGTVVTDDGRYVPTPKPQERPSPYGFDTPSTPKASRGGSARGAHAYTDEVASINERTAALKASTAAQAAINPLVNDFGYASQKAATEQKLLADAQKAGMQITPQLREQISQLADQYAQASAESKQLAASQEEIKKKAQEFADLEKDTFGGFLKDLKDGKSGVEALSNALKKIADKLLDMAVNSLFSTKTGVSSGGTASTGLFSSIFSGIGKLLGFASGTANTGGRRGQPVGIVHGEEAVIPLPAGGKVPVTISSPSTSDMAKKSSRDTLDINLTDDSGRMASIADKRIQTASGTIVQVATKQSYKQVQSNMHALMTDAQERHGK